MLPTEKQSTDFEVLEEGTYEVTLKSLDLEISQEYQSDLRYQSAVMTWNVDDETFVEKFVKVSTNERSKFFNCLSALLGRRINDDDKIKWGLSENIDSGLILDKYHKDKTSDEYVKDGEQESGYLGHVDSLEINGDDMIGKSCMLNVTINASGYNRAAAGAGSPLPKKVGKKKAAPAGAPA